MPRRVLSALLFLMSGLAPTSTLAKEARGIQQLTEVSGKAEVVDKRSLNIHHAYGIASVKLMWPAEDKRALYRQLATAVQVRCLLFGSPDAANCIAIDQFGSSWLLGRTNQLALSR